MPPADDFEREDPRLSLVLSEVTRALTQQLSAIDALRTRAGTVVAAASLASSFLGAAVLADNSLRCLTLLFTILALFMLVVTLVSTIVILWPYVWKTGFDAKVAIADYVEADEPATLNEMRRSFAWYIQEDVAGNQAKLDSLYGTFRVAVVSLGLQVCFWLAALALR